MYFTNVHLLICTPPLISSAIFFIIWNSNFSLLFPSILTPKTLLRRWFLWSSLGQEGAVLQCRKAGEYTITCLRFLISSPKDWSRVLLTFVLRWLLGPYFRFRLHLAYSCFSISLNPYAFCVLRSPQNYQKSFTALVFVCQLC